MQWFCNSLNDVINTFLGQPWRGVAMVRNPLIIAHMNFPSASFGKKTRGRKGLEQIS